MPTYSYHCDTNDHDFDIVQRFADDALTVCPECGGSVRRVIQPVGVVFKGSGWYINDSRKSSEGAGAGSRGKSSEKSESAGEKSTGEKGSSEKSSSEKTSGEKSSGEKATATAEKATAKAAD